MIPYLNQVIFNKLEFPTFGVSTYLYEIDNEYIKKYYILLGDFYSVKSCFNLLIFNTLLRVYYYEIRNFKHCFITFFKTQQGIGTFYKSFFNNLKIFINYFLSLKFMFSELKYF